MVLSSSHRRAIARPTSKLSPNLFAKNLVDHDAVGQASAYWEPLKLPECRLFGTDGIRGRVGDILTAELAAQVGYWAGRTLKSVRNGDHCVIVGQDSRNSGPMLAQALAGGLTAAGIEVWDLGLCPTPTVAHLASCTEAIGGVMISASHNPPGDNGIKFFGETGTKLSKVVQQQIEALLRQGFQSTAQYPTTQWGRYYQD